MDLGLGRFGLGLGSFGYGVPAKANSTSVKLFLDQTKEQRNAAEINTVSGDIVRDQVTGIHRGMDSVEQQVYLALRTLRGSSVIADLGINIKIKVISDTLAQKVRDAVTEALSSLVSRRLVRVESISVERIKLTGVRVIVKWFNMTNGETITSRWDNG